ncbi:MAG TPA: hypothetical protein VJT31_04040, partial [Rugosimonospora sp.]|nr:hypothetical protein [Rugosimonospora sp.]
MPSNRRWSVSDGRKLATAILAVFAFFIISASIGAQSWELAALGVAFLAAGITLYVVSAMNSRSFAYVPGTAHVISSSPPPAAALQGRCEMQIVVHAPGMDDVAVKIRDAGVPVSKWPDPGATLPILVAIGDPRRVRVLWDNVRTHGEMADGRGEVFDGEVAVDERYDLFENFPEGLVGGDDLYGDANVIEMDVIDPSRLLLEPDEPRYGPSGPRTGAAGTATASAPSETVRDEAVGMDVNDPVPDSVAHTATEPAPPVTAEPVAEPPAAEPGVVEPIVAISPA